MLPATSGDWVEERHRGKVALFGAGNLLTVRGMVTRMSGIKSLAVGMSFTCSKCKESTENKEFPDGAFAPPTVCPGDGCRGRTFLPHWESAKRICFQRIR